MTIHHHSKRMNFALLLSTGALERVPLGIVSTPRNYHHWVRDFELVTVRPFGEPAYYIPGRHTKAIAQAFLDAYAKERAEIEARQPAQKDAAWTRRKVRRAARAGLLP